MYPASLASRTGRSVIGRAGSVAIAAALAALASAGDDGLLLQMEFEGDLALAPGHGAATFSGAEAPAYVEGKFGRALDLGTGQRVMLRTEGNIDRARGTVCMWIKPHWAGDLYQNHVFLQDDLPFETGANCLRLWHWCVGLARFDVRDEGDRYITSPVKSWRAEEWHHLAATWDTSQGTGLYIDGHKAAARQFEYQSKPSPRLILGGIPTGDDALATLDDLRIYDRPLTPDQVRRVASGRPIEAVEYLSARGPAQVAVGEPFKVSLRFRAPQGLTGPYEVRAQLAAIPLGELALQQLPPPGREATAGPLEVTVPAYAYPPPGRQTLSLRVSGAAHVRPERADLPVTLVYPSAPAAPRWSVSDSGAVLRNGKPFRAEPGWGLLVRGEFLGADRADEVNELVASGAIIDALPCRLVDEVDCSTDGHGFHETAPSAVEELLPGRKFRLTGEQEDVTETGKRLDREFKVLPGFSYDLSVAPRPTPHVVVVESVDDGERYLEVAIDAAEGSALDPHLQQSGMGARDAMNLCVTYNGREYEPSGRTYRESYLVFPKTDRISVMITCSRHSQGLKSSAPAAVSHIWVYEAALPLRQLPNPVTEPKTGPKRSIGLFDPEIGGMFERYGFTNAGPESRGQTLRRFVDYSRFLGFNRYEFRPFQLSERAYFHCRQFDMAGDLDMFQEFLPLAREAGIAVLPRVMYLHSYHRMLEDDPDNFQQTRTGETLTFGREGPIPDPLRPAVQKVVMDSFEAMLEATAGFRGVVPGLCYDTSIGGLYEYRDGPSSEVGYSASNVRDFCDELGLQLPASVTDHQSRYDWLRENHWEAWLDWRAQRWHDFVCALRDRVKQDGADREFVLSLRVMPRQQWADGEASLEQVYRQCLYAPGMFRDERGVRMSWFTRINADRYFGKLWWKAWFCDPAQPELTHTPEPRGHEMYYNYWELPTHPWGFRVGPGSPVGRAFFEPYTYALRTMDPEYILVFCWFRGSYGHEADLREWARAFRALPAVTPRDFEGRATPQSDDEHLWIRWFGPRLAVLNDGPEARDVTLDIPPPHKGVNEVFDANTCRAVPMTMAGDSLRVRLALRPYDLRPLIFRPEP